MAVGASGGGISGRSHPGSVIQSSPHRSEQAAVIGEAIAATSAVIARKCRVAGLRRQIQTGARSTIPNSPNCKAAVQSTRAAWSMTFARVGFIAVAPRP